MKEFEPIRNYYRNKVAELTRDKVSKLKQKHHYPLTKDECFASGDVLSINIEYSGINLPYLSKKK